MDPILNFAKIAKSIQAGEGTKRKHDQLMCDRARKRGISISIHQLSRIPAIWFSWRSGDEKQAAELPESTVSNGTLYGGIECAIHNRS
jgi:hypothetical protein